MSNNSTLQIIKQKYPDLINLKNIREYDAIPKEIRNSLDRLWEGVQESDNIPNPFMEEMYELTDLFDQAEAVIEELWKEDMDMLLNQFLYEFADRPGISSELIYALTSENINRSIYINYFGALEELSTLDKKAWGALLAMASERQGLVLCIIKKWIDDNKNSAEFLTKLDEFGINLAELKIVIEIADNIGRLIDLAYIKQVILAEDVLNNEKPEDGGNYRRVYVSEDQQTFYSDIDFFEYEIGLIVKNFREIRIDIIRKCNEKLLPPKKDYELLGAYIEKLADAYEQPGIDLNKLNKVWEECDESLIRLLKSSCPIFVFPQHVPALANGNVLDLELRINIRTKETRAIEDRYEKLLKHVTEINSQYGYDRSPPLLIIANQPSAYGTNLYWRTRGEELKGRVCIIHPEPIEKVAELNEIPLIEKLFPDALESVGIKRYLRATFNETVRHELGHAVLPLDEPVILERIGEGENKYIIEELKAETVNMLILQADNEMPIELKYEKILAKIGTCLDVFINKSHEEGSAGERYYIPALVIMDKLFDTNVVTRVNERGYEILDPELGIQAISEIGRYVLDRFYGTQKENIEKDLDVYINQLRQTAHNSSIIQLFKDLTIG